MEDFGMDDTHMANRQIPPTQISPWSMDEVQATGKSRRQVWCLKLMDHSFEWEHGGYNVGLLGHNLDLVV